MTTASRSPTPRPAVPLHRDSGQRNSSRVEATLDPEALTEIDPTGPRILPRLFAQIANEAAFALEEGVASPDDMETAMRLGLNWPLGPLGITGLIGAGARRRAAARGWRPRLGDAYARRRACWPQPRRVQA